MMILCLVVTLAAAAISFARAHAAIDNRPD
jgi:hypothetical protein